MLFICSILTLLLFLIPYVALARYLARRHREFYKPFLQLTAGVAGVVILATLLLHFFGGLIMAGMILGAFIMSFLLLLLFTIIIVDGSIYLANKNPLLLGCLIFAAILVVNAVLLFWLFINSLIIL